MGESTENQIRNALTRLAGDSRIYRQQLRDVVRPAVELLAQDYEPADPLLTALRILEDWSRYAERIALAALQDVSS